MASSRILLLLLCCLSLFSAPSASTFISDDIFGQQGVNQRRLLQIEKPCPVNLEKLNYSILTSQCKGPDYPPKPCCNAFKEIACPIVDYIDDLTTNCAQTMFSYIDAIGHYPVGLFSSLCREGAEGLLCPSPAPAPAPSPNETTSSRILILQLLPILFFSLFYCYYV